MQMIYTHENRYLVLNLKNVLENAGIEVMLKNEFAGGGAGELAPIETWLELWLVNDGDYDKARALIADIGEPQGKDWLCPNCGEHNGAAFEVCWQCGQAPA